jgi:type VI secretion system protein ImpL
MKNTLVKILKFTLYALAVVLLILLVFGIVFWLDWPWWVAFFLLLIIAGLAVAAFVIKRILKRKNEQRFVQDVIEQDEARIKTFSAAEQNEAKALQERWKEAIGALQRSHLKKLGNPLYVLPWYMVIGESGSGKTTAIGSAKLSSPFAEATRASGISGTKNCDWWFFEQAVIIDTAGRYAIPVDEGRDKEEWQQFLNLLIKYRKKEPIHGLIVTVAADKLLSGNVAVLEEDGRNIRRRIDELMRVLGIKFPIYLLVTKGDLVQGMTHFADQLPAKGVEQPMGYINQNMSKDVSAFLSSAMTTIAERLRTIRLLLLHKPESKTADPALLLFPEEFEGLQNGLSVFMKAAFQENPYQETPLLRGLFFSSGRQEGSPYSHFLEALGLIEEKEVLPGTNRGLFLHEYFAKILPSDRRLFAPTSRALEWQSLTRNLGITAWILICVALCGLLSFSFVKNLRTIRSVSHEFVQPPVVRGDLLTDLVTMDRFRQAISNVEEQNRGWWVPRFGLNESIKLEKGLKEKFCKQFYSGFLAPFDRQTQETMPRLIASSGTQDELVGQYIVHLVRRINLLKAKTEGLPFEKLKEKPQPSYVSLLAQEQSNGPEVRRKFGLQYLSYLAWRTDTGDVNKEIVILQAWLGELLKANSNLSWLTVWVDKESGLPPIKLADFWGGSQTLPDEKSISPAFTRKGKEMIDSLLKEMETALPDPILLEANKAAYQKRYASLSFDSWYAFASYFPKGASKLKGEKEWQAVAGKMAGEQDPYFAFINKASLELEPLASEITPDWADQIFQFQLAKAQSYLGGGGTVAKAAEEGKKMMASLERTAGRTGRGQAIESQVAAGKAYQELSTALASIVPAATSRSQAYQLTVQAFTEEPGSGKSPFSSGYNAAAKIKANLGRGKSADEVVARLINGPMDFLWSGVRIEAACHLQSQWEEKVLAETQGASDQQALQMILSPSGAVWKFVKAGGPAAPFIGWHPVKGYYAKEALSSTIPFDPSIFPFLIKGSKITAAAASAASATASAAAPGGGGQGPGKKDANVGIRAVPTDVNSEATRKPHAVKLELHCSSGVQSLANYQYMVNKTFAWSADTCSDVILQIEVGDVVLTKKYEGEEAFIDFLREFRGGKRVFYPKEFPVERAALERMGIKYIRVNYNFTGEGALITQAKEAKAKAAELPSNVVRKIARCWEE